MGSGCKTRKLTAEKSISDLGLMSLVGFLTRPSSSRLYSTHSLPRLLHPARCDPGSRSESRLRPSQDSSPRIVVAATACSGSSVDHHRSFGSSARLLKKKMPPKKAAAAEKKILLGRPGNNLKIGIVGAFSDCHTVSDIQTKGPSGRSTGLPNVGKSSFFNVLSNTGSTRAS